ncbi:MAG: DUF1538 family protein [Dysosmobacter welbionis]
MGGNVVTDAFGVVAMVAMTPLLTIQMLGLLYQLKHEESRSGDASRPGGRGDHRAVSSPSDIVKRGETAMQGVDLFITITDRSPGVSCSPPGSAAHGIPLVLTALGQGTATTEVAGLSRAWRPRRRPVLFCRVPPVPACMVRQGGPGPVAGRAGPGRSDDGAGVQHQRHRTAKEYLTA